MESQGKHLENTGGNQPRDMESELVDSSSECGVSVIAEAAQKTASSHRRKSSSAFRTISEVAKYLDVQQHVLRFWETKFSQIKPLKRGGGRRYYRPEDVDLLKAIHNLLYVEGYTIKGVQKLLREVGKKQIITSFGSNEKTSNMIARTNDIDSSAISVDVKPKQKNKRMALESVLSELKDLRGMIKPK